LAFNSLKKDTKMKLIKTASGKKAIKLSKSEWETIGKKAGWMKEARELTLDDRESSDIDWGSALYGKGGEIISIYRLNGTPLSKEEILALNKTNADERLTDPEPMIASTSNKISKEAGSLSPEEALGVIAFAGLEINDIVSSEDFINKSWDEKYKKLGDVKRACAVINENVESMLQGMLKNAPDVIDGNKKSDNF
jgi:hypothetical protein